MTRKDAIVLSCVRQHNLKGVDCSFPKGALTVVTGLSGSGKSSLVMDTLYAEGFRRYTEALSAYARRFLDKKRRPDVEFVSGIQPAVAFGQRNRARGARSTVGTATEVVDLLRVLYARGGTVFCPKCHIPIGVHTPETAAEEALRHFSEDEQLYVTFRYPLPKEQREDRVKSIVRDGYNRYLSKKGVERLDVDKPPRRKELQIIVDRTVVKEKKKARLTESLAAAFRVGEGKAELISEKSPTLYLQNRLSCSSCSDAFPILEPQQLSFNNPLGACPTCSGFGRVPTIDVNRVVPDAHKTLEEGAILPFTSPTYEECWDDLLQACVNNDIPSNVPYRDLTKAQKKFIWEGQGSWYGIDGFFGYLKKKRYKMHFRILLSRYRSFENCPDCLGTRLKPEASNVLLADTTLPALCALPIDEVQAFLFGLTLAKEKEVIVRNVLRELRRRIDYLVDVGLGYLTLDRQTRTLSGGEAQRINLASALGASLNDTLYVLDEPSIGLHPADLDRLIKILRTLSGNNNTVVIVEHEPRVIEKADHVIDLGPGAGRFGGRVLFAGTPEELKKEKTDTAIALTAAKDSLSNRRVRKHSGSLTICKAAENNLKNIDVKIPLGVMTCITGLSGSGKSTLLEQVLYAGLKRLRGEPIEEVGKFDDILGIDQIESLELIDQSPVARSGRSNPATFMKVFSPIRSLLAATPKAKERGLRAGFFSFNVSGGRCEKCEGEGEIEVDLQFLGDTTIPCDLCFGKRFGEEAQAIRYRGSNVVDILEMTIDDGVSFFSDKKKIVNGLEILKDMGLGYLRLGQPTSTLSAGESQRLKLARHLGGKAKSLEGCLLLLDEPTTGLHPKDIDNLLRVLEELLEKGASLVLVEHNLDVIARADHIIDLGPGGGQNGGRLVASGSPTQIAQTAHSVTGSYLAALL